MIRFPFAINDRLGRLAQENDYEQYIIQLIRQVLFTAQGERINRPDFGAGVKRLVHPSLTVGARLKMAHRNFAKHTQPFESVSRTR